MLLVLLARIFGSESFGGYVALLSVAVLGLILIEGGWPTRLYRETVDGGASVVPEALAAERHAAIRHAVAYVASVGLALSLMAWILGGAARLAAGMAFGCMVMVALSNLVSARLRGDGRFAQEALWQGGGRLASAALIVLVVMQVAATPVWVFASWAAALAVLLLVWGRFWLASPQWRGLAGGYRFALPFLAIDGCAVFLLRGDMAILGALDLPATHLSYYAAGTRFTEAAVLLFAPVTNVMLRTLRLSLHDDLAFRRELRFALALALGAGIVAVIASVLLGQFVMTEVFGADYREAGRLLPWIAASLPLMLVNLVLIQAAAARGRENLIARSLLGACVLLGVGLYLGSQFDGVYGSAAGAIAAHFCVGLMLAWLMRPVREAPR